MNLNQRISGYGRKLTKSEQRLIEELQTRYPQGLLESATSLAKKVGTSASTVVRLLAKLGYPATRKRSSRPAPRSRRGWPRPPRAPMP